jgi:hypothetical protein
VKKFSYSELEELSRTSQIEKINEIIDFIDKTLTSSENSIEKIKLLEILNNIAENGHNNAQYILGCYYHSGKNVPQSWGDAIKWYHLSADQGNSMAEFAIGCCYENGYGIKKSWDDAFKWYKKAYENGNLQAAEKIYKQQGQCPFCEETVKPEILIKTWRFGPIRDDLKCPNQNCGERIYTCRTPGCHHYTKGASGYDHQLCLSCAELFSEATVTILKQATSVIFRIVEHTAKKIIDDAMKGDKNDKSKR